MQVDPIDSNYLQFFFLQAPMFLLFTQHFPSAPSAIFELASQHAPTLQSILAVSAQHADMVAGRKPTRALIHLIEMSTTDSKRIDIGTNQRGSYRGGILSYSSLLCSERTYRRTKSSTRAISNVGTISTGTLGRYTQ